MKRIFLLAAVAAVGISAFAGERTVSTAADLVNALEELSDSQAAAESVVYLERGNYDVGPYNMKYFKKNTSTRYDQESHLASAKVRMIGKGTSPRDVVIYGNRTTRVLIDSRSFYYGRGCTTCNNTGYKGRKGIFEYLRVGPAIREMINERKPTLLIRERARELGMRTMREDGVRNILDGYTSVDEVLRYT